MVGSLIITLGALLFAKFIQYILLLPKPTATMAEATIFHCWAPTAFWLPCWLGLGYPGSRLEMEIACKRITEECSGGEGSRTGQKKFICDMVATRHQVMPWGWIYSPSEPPLVEAFVMALISHLIPAVPREEQSPSLAVSFCQELLPERVLAVSCQQPMLLELGAHARPWRSCLGYVQQHPSHWFSPNPELPFFVCVFLLQINFAKCNWLCFCPAYKFLRAHSTQVQVWHPYMA